MRDLTISDIVAVREIDRLAFAPGDQYDAVFYDAVMSSGEFQSIGVTDGEGRIVGWTLVDLTRQPMRIRSLSIHPEFRRRGYAVALVLEILTRHGSHVDLLVEDDNAAALALYSRLGFLLSDPDSEMPLRKRMVRSPDQLDTA